MVEIIFETQFKKFKIRRLVTWLISIERVNQKQIFNFAFACIICAYTCINI